MLMLRRLESCFSIQLYSLQIFSPHGAYLILLYIHSSIYSPSTFNVEFILPFIHFHPLLSLLRVLFMCFSSSFSGSTRMKITWILLQFFPSSLFSQQFFSLLFFPSFQYIIFRLRPFSTAVYFSNHIFFSLSFSFIAHLRFLSHTIHIIHKMDEFFLLIPAINGIRITVDVLYSCCYEGFYVKRFAFSLHIHIQLHLWVCVLVWFVSIFIQIVGDFKEYK